MAPRKDSPVRDDAARSGSMQGVAAAGDDALMMRIAQGDGRAFEALVAQRLDRVVAVARRMLGNDADAEEVAQEAFLRLWRRADRWEPGRAQVSTWLYRVATNLCIDHMRRRRGEHAQETVPEQEQPAAQQRVLEEADLRRRMDDALQSLPERQRMALVLFHYEGLAMSEAAELMQVSVDALESLLARGRRTLKQQLDGQWRSLLPEQDE